MNWYYEEAGKQAGPVDDAGLEALVTSGQITPNTLVWAEGMANWQPYGQVRSGGAPAGAPPVLAPASGGEEAVCAECGGIFPIGETIRIGSAQVCAGCKPTFLQKMREGVNTVGGVGQLELASIGLRFAARFLDGVLLFVINMALNFVFLGAAATLTGPSGRSDATAIVSIVVFIELGFGFAYEVFFLGRFGATPGKMACKIKVVTGDGQPISYGRAVGRYFAYLLNAFTCLIGFIIAFFDDQKRTLHDRICDTRVVMK